MDIRTDLVYEVVNNIGTDIEGVECVEAEYKGIKVSRIQLKSDGASERLGKRKGNYTTVFCPNIVNCEGNTFLAMMECISEELTKLLKGVSTNILVVGLGNTSVTPDALGPLSVQSIVVSRHIKRGMESLFNSLKLGEIAAIAPGVLGQTGVESAEIIKAVADKIKPSAIIVIDSLVSREAGRLAKTVQLSDTGIIPGSGLNNNRFEISLQTMDIPVVTMGIPLVIDAKSLVKDFASNGEVDNKALEKSLNSLNEFDGNLVVTPKAIDAIVEKSARLVGFSINKTIHQDLTVEDMASLLS